MKRGSTLTVSGNQAAIRLMSTAPALPEGYLPDGYSVRKVDYQVQWGNPLSLYTIARDGATVTYDPNTVTGALTGAATSVTLMEYAVDEGDDDDDKDDDRDTGSTTESERNPDGSLTTTVTKPDGTTVETTRNPDGSKETVETKKDGTVVTTATDKSGNETVTTESPDGTSVISVTRTDGSTSATTVDEDGPVRHRGGSLRQRCGPDRHRVPAHARRDRRRRSLQRTRCDPGFAGGYRREGGDPCGECDRRHRGGAGEGRRHQ